MVQCCPFVFVFINIHKCTITSQLAIVGCCLVTKGFIGKLLAIEKGWVTKRLADDEMVHKMHHASHAPQSLLLCTVRYVALVCVCVCGLTTYLLSMSQVRRQP